MAAGASPWRQVTSQLGRSALWLRIYRQSHEAWTSSSSGECSLLGLSTANLRSPTGSGQKAAAAATKLPRPTASGAAISWPEAETDSARLVTLHGTSARTPSGRRLTRKPRPASATSSRRRCWSPWKGHLRSVWAFNSPHPCCPVQ